jgi:hypothetical protein
LALKKTSASLVLIFLTFSFAFLSEPPSHASLKVNQIGLFDCFKPTNYAKKGSLTRAFNKSVESKTSKDWFNSYLLARLYTGNPKCFNAKDVQTMSKIVSTINNICSGNSAWGEVCYISGGTGKLANWAYDNA